jgi:phage gp46-like protein
MTGTVDVVWWITAVELPALGGLFWLLTRLRRDSETALEALRARAETAQAQVRESLAAYKLEVAKTYASHDALKDVEIRLTDHLLRIEHKLECVAEAGR